MGRPGDLVDILFEKHQVVDFPGDPQGCGRVNRGINGERLQADVGPRGIYFRADSEVVQAEPSALMKLW
jgi:hypothetical protein